ncbi:MAG: methionyl-tRNA formyltransferase [Planctomycetota bacterium]|jgi:methionyl-tRNA formyltransferase|nr:methionyl-tRNA formyltransferase [Planctomycetota bacterium]
MAMRLMFFGSGDFGAKTLETLVSQERRPLAVVSQPGRPAGRGRKPSPTPISRLAAGLGLPLLTPETPNTPDFAAEMRRLAPDLALVVAYGRLIRRDILDIPRLGFVNLHASLLPAYRGAAPVPWAILQGESESGVTVFRLNERFDAGQILARQSLAINPDDTAGSYLEKLAPVGAALVSQTLLGLEAGEVEPEPQDESRVSVAPKFKKKDGRIDWRRSWAEIDRQVRAFQPWPLAYAFVPAAKGEVRINVLGISRSGTEGRGAKPGTLLSADAESGLTIMTGDFPVRLVSLQPEGRRPMSDTDFLRGTRINI